MWNSKSSVAVACFLPCRAKDLSEPLYFRSHCFINEYIRISALLYLKSNIYYTFDTACIIATCTTPKFFICICTSQQVNNRKYLNFYKLILYYVNICVRITECICFINLFIESLTSVAINLPIYQTTRLRYRGLYCVVRIACKMENVKLEATLNMHSILPSSP